MAALFGTLAALLIGATDLFGRRIANAASALTAAGSLQIVAAVAALASAFVISGEVGGTDLLLGALSGLGMAVGLGSYYTGLTKSSSAVVAPLTATLSTLLAFLYAVFRGAGVSAWALLGAAIAVAGLGLVSSGAGERANLVHGLMWGTISGCGYGFALAVLVDVSDEAGVWPAVPQRLVAFVAIMSFAKASGQLKRIPAKVRFAPIAGGIVMGLMSVFYLLAVREGPVVAVVTTSLFPVVNVAVGRLAFGDEVMPRQFVGALLSVLGIVLVVAG